jgi:hypothetical protein
MRNSSHCSLSIFLPKIDKPQEENVNEWGNKLSRRRVIQLLSGGGVATIAAGAIDSSALAATAASKPAVAKVANGYQDGFTRARPENVGINPQSILDFLADLERSNLELDSFMLYRDGAVVAEGWWWPYRPDLIHMMHSLTKSVTVGAIGMALAAGKFKLTDKVVSFYPDELPAQVSDNLAAMTIEDLLTMKTGHDRETSGSNWRSIKTSWVAEFHKIPVVYKPGTQWVYTSAATYMLSAIFSRTMGMSVYEHLKPTFFDPLDIHGEEWFTGPQDITPGANGLSWHTADCLKLGVLYLQGGKWNGKQILPPEWTEECHKPHTPGRYGYQWWLDPNNAFSARGLFGQLSFVWPDQKAVLACTSAVKASAAVAEVVYRHFPAAFQNRVSLNPRALAALTAKQKNLRLLEPLKPSESPLATQISGRTYYCDKNEDAVSQIRLDIRDNVCLFHLRNDRGDHKVKCGLGEWIESFTTITGAKLHHGYESDMMRVVAGGSWKDRNTLELTWQFTESVFRDTVVCRFDRKSMTFDRRVNVNSSALARPTIRGTQG